jgi:hypothetical protein
MKSTSVIFAIIAVLLVPFVYGSSIPDACAEPSGSMTCYRTGTLTRTCCQDHIINRSPSNPAGTLVTYCTDCKVGPGGTSDECGERYIPMGAEQPLTPIPPAAVARLQEGGVLGEATTLPEVSVLEAQRANITILPGGIIQEANTSSNDSSTRGILGMDQSDLVSDETENTTSTANDGEEQHESETTEEEQDESGPIKDQAREGVDESDDKENIDEELPLE